MTSDRSSKEWNDESLDWENAYTSSAKEFFADFNLHDSYWAGIHSEPERRDLICVFELDTVWNPTIVPHGNTAPYLLVRFTHCYQLTFSDDKDHGDPTWPYVVTGAHSGLLSENTYGPMQKVVNIGASPIYHTVFEGIGESSVHIIHSGDVQVRCYNWDDGSEIPIHKP